MGRILESSNRNPRNCSVCSHPERAEIEKLILSMSPSNPKLTLDCIADAFDISSKDLRVHALMHTPLALSFEDDAEQQLVDNFKERAGADCSEQNGEQVKEQTRSKTERLTDKLNLRESDMLLASANEMLTTMTTLGRRIKHFASDSSDSQADQRMVNFCTNAVVNLYVGTSTELRKTISEIRALNESINGAHDSASDGLKALAEAIHGSYSAMNEPEQESVSAIGFEVDEDSYESED